MVHLTSIVGFAVLYAGFVSAVPMPDSASGGEIPVSAPDGIPMSDTKLLPQSTPTDTGSGWTSTPPASSTSVWSSPPPAVTSPTYGSGSSSGGSSSSGLDSCVQQCQAQFGSPPSMGSSGGSGSGGSSPGGSGSGGSSSTTTSSIGSPSGGATHTVIVAPSQGVLRYVPFAVNASVGDTVKFLWGANNHTVTKSSQLSLCNKTQDAPFTSGVHLKDFVFEQVVNDTNTIFFYCGVPNHCQKGMFGIINPPNALASSTTSIGSVMQGMAANNPQMKSMLAYASNATSGRPVASGWGRGIDMSGVPEWSHQYVAEGVLYTRTFLAANPDVIKADGTIDLGLSGNRAVVPQDIVAAALNYGDSSLSPASPSAGKPASSSGPKAAVSGASAVSRSGALVGFAALAAGFFLL